MEEYALGGDEPIDEGIRRIYLSCMEEIFASLAPPVEHLHEAIHNTRKNFKFIRALIRLIRKPLGSEQYKQENQAYRDLGRHISKLRDLHVMIALIESMPLATDSIQPKDIKHAVKELRLREDELLENILDKKGRFKSISFGLEQAKKRLRYWHAIPNDIETLLPGLEIVYGKGCESFQEAGQYADDEHFHEWRKQVKYLLHHYQILQNYWPQSLAVNGENLQQLSDLLGKEHDFAMFKVLLSDKSFTKKLKNKGKEAIQSYVHHQQSELKKSALELGEVIYAKSNEEFISFFHEPGKYI